MDIYSLWKNVSQVASQSKPNVAYIDVSERSTWRVKEQTAQYTDGRPITKAKRK